MGVLDGKIVNGIDYRPCIVTIPAVTKKYRSKEKIETRIIEPEKKAKALFHYWLHRSEVVGESYLVGGHAAGQVSGAFAIVEFEDGTIKEVEPWNIKFVEGLINDYSFGRED